MLAHTAKWAVGRTRKGSGSKLSELDRDGNNEADLLAKRGAKLHRMPKLMRDKVELAELVAHRAAAQLGVTTEAANNHAVQSFDANGALKIKKIRDSDGVPRTSALRKLREKVIKEEKVKKATKTACSLAKRA